MSYQQKIDIIINNLNKINDLESALSEAESAASALNRELGSIDEAVKESSGSIKNLNQEIRAIKNINKGLGSALEQGRGAGSFSKRQTELQLRKNEERLAAALDERAIRRSAQRDRVESARQKRFYAERAGVISRAARDDRDSLNKKASQLRLEIALEARRNVEIKRFEGRRQEFVRKGSGANIPEDERLSAEKTIKAFEKLLKAPKARNNRERFEEIRTLNSLSQELEQYNRLQNEDIRLQRERSLIGRRIKTGNDRINEFARKGVIKQETADKLKSIGMAASADAARGSTELARRRLSDLEAKLFDYDRKVKTVARANAEQLTNQRALNSIDTLQRRIDNLRTAGADSSILSGPQKAVADLSRAIAKGDVSKYRVDLEKARGALANLERSERDRLTTLKKQQEAANLASTTEKKILSGRQLNSKELEAWVKGGAIRALPPAAGFPVDQPLPREAMLPSGGARMIGTSREFITNAQGRRTNIPALDAAGLAMTLPLEPKRGRSRRAVSDPNAIDILSKTDPNFTVAGRNIFSIFSDQLKSIAPAVANSAKAYENEISTRRKLSNSIATTETRLSSFVGRGTIGNDAAQPIRDALAEISQEARDTATPIDDLRDRLAGLKNTISSLAAQSVKDNSFAAGLKKIADVPKQRADYLGNLSPEQAIDQLVRTVNKQIPGAKTGVDSAANNVVNTFTDRIKSGASKAATAASDMTSAFRQAVKKGLGIASPSRFMIEMANNLINTYISQLEKAFPRIKSTTEKTFGIGQSFYPVKPAFSYGSNLSRNFNSGKNRVFDFGASSGGNFPALPQNAGMTAMMELLNTWSDAINNASNVSPEALSAKTVTQMNIPDPWEFVVADYKQFFVELQTILDGAGESLRTTSKEYQQFIDSIIKATGQIKLPGSRVAGALLPSGMTSGDPWIGPLANYRQLASMAEQIARPQTQARLALPPAQALPALPPAGMTASSARFEEARRAAYARSDQRAAEIMGAGGTGGAPPRTPAAAAGGSVPTPGQDAADRARRALLTLADLGNVSRLSTNAIRASIEEFTNLRASIDATDANFERLDEQLRQTIARFDDQIQRRDPNADFLTRRLGTRGGRAVSEGLIGGAFPLLFGQGLGASAGGLIGGAAGGFAGGMLGFGLSLVGTAIGSAVDTTVQNLKTLAAGLKSPNDAIAALETSGIKVGSTLKFQVQQLQSLGRAYDAQTLVLREVQKRLGADGVRNLVALEVQQKKLEEQWSSITGVIQGQLLPVLVGFTEVINGILNAARAAANDPIVGKILETLGKSVLAPVPGASVAAVAIDMASRRGARTATNTPIDVRPPIDPQEAFAAETTRIGESRRIADQVKSAYREAFNLQRQAYDLQREAADFNRDVADYSYKKEREIFDLRQQVAESVIDNNRAAAQNRIENSDLNARALFASAVGFEQQLLTNVREVMRTRKEGEADIEQSRKKLELTLAKLNRDVEDYKRTTAREIEDIERRKLSYVRSVEDYKMQVADYVLARAREAADLMRQAVTLPDMSGIGGGATGSGANSGYFARLAELESNSGKNWTNPSSNARGFFQLIPKTERWLNDIGKGDVAARMLSRDFSTAAQAAKEFAIIMRPAAKSLLEAGDVAGLDRLLNRIWTSLPGGSEAATGQRLASANALLMPRSAVSSVNQTAQGGQLLDRFGVAWQSQLDNAGGQGWRECFTTVSAMIASGSKGVNIPDDVYNQTRKRFGDTTSMGAQISALQSIGVSARGTTSARISDLRAEYAAGRSIGVGITSDSGTTSGHWVYVSGMNDQGISLFDPNRRQPWNRQMSWQEFGGRFNPGGAGGYMVSAPGATARNTQMMGSTQISNIPQPQYSETPLGPTPAAAPLNKERLAVLAAMTGSMKEAQRILEEQIKLRQKGVELGQIESILQDNQLPQLQQQRSVLQQQLEARKRILNLSDNAASVADIEAEATARLAQLEKDRTNAITKLKKEYGGNADLIKQVNEQANLAIGIAKKEEEQRRKNLELSNQLQGLERARAEIIQLQEKVAVGRVEAAALELGKLQASNSEILKTTLLYKQASEEQRNLLENLTTQAEQQAKINELQANYNNKLRDAQDRIVEIFAGTSGLTEYQKALREIATKGIQNDSGQADGILQTAKAIDLLNQKIRQLERVKDIAGAWTDSFIGFNAELLKTGNLSDALTKWGEGISSRAIDILLEITMRPIQDQIFGSITKFLGFEQPGDPMVAPLSSLDVNVKSIKENVAIIAGGISGNTQSSVEALAQPATLSGIKFYTPPAAVESGSPWSTASLQAASDNATVKLQSFSDNVLFASDTASNFGISFVNTLESSDKIFSSAVVASEEGAAKIKAAYDSRITTEEENIGKLQMIGQKLGTGIQILGGIAMGVAGVQQMKKGGTYNVLMGLAGIFGAISQVSYGSGKLFGLKGFAEGGRPPMGQPSWVGENGPELWWPDRAGTIIPVDQLYVPGRPLPGESSSTAQGDEANSGSADSSSVFSATRASLEQQRAAMSGSADSGSQSMEPQVIDVRSESTVINSVEYVTMEQHRKGMQEAAKMGQALSYQGIRGSVPTRRRLAI